MARCLAIAIETSVFLIGGAALAAPPGPGQHFDCSTGGTNSCATDDTGCVPSTPDTLECAAGLVKAFLNAVKALEKCHCKQAGTLLAGKSFDEEACENGTGAPRPGKSAREKLDAALTKLEPLCSSQQLLDAHVEEQILFADKSQPLSADAQIGETYCDSTSGAMVMTSDSDDAGWVPHTKDILKCECAFGRNQVKLGAAIAGCHVKMAASFFGGKDFDERTCEELDSIKHKSAVEKYDAAAAALVGKGTCPPCADLAHQTARGEYLRAQLDSANSLAYPCH